MTNQKQLGMIVAIAALFAIPTTLGLAYADDGFGIFDGIGIGGELAVLGTGALAGVILSVSRVIGKHVKGKGEQIDPRRLGINIIVGAGVGYLLVSLGLDTEAALGGNFLALYIVNQFLVPVFGNWIKGNGNSATPKSGF